MDEIIVIGGDLGWVNELDELVNVALPNALGYQMADSDYAQFFLTQNDQFIESSV